MAPFIHLETVHHSDLFLQWMLRESKGMMMMMMMMMMMEAANFQSDQAVAQWRFSLTAVCSCVSSEVEGRGGASHKKRRMTR